MSQSIICCLCDNSKKHRLVFDGGSSGHYIVELCKKCYRLQDKQFLIAEERLDDTAATATGGE